MAMLVADELISNAVHNAPVDAERRALPRRARRATSSSSSTTATRSALRWGCDARYLAIEVTDQFGSLDRDTILARARASTTSANPAAGAGMGVALSYRSCDHLVFNLAPGKRTEIIALIDVRYPPTERMPASSYNVFVESAVVTETRGRLTIDTGAGSADACRRDRRDRGAASSCWRARRAASWSSTSPA